MTKTESFVAAGAAYSLRFDSTPLPGCYAMTIVNSSLSKNPLAVFRGLVAAVCAFIQGTEDFRELSFRAVSTGNTHDPRKSAFFMRVGQEVVKTGLAAMPLDPTASAVVFTKETFSAS